MLLADNLKPELGLPCSLNLLLQDAPLSDCTETIEGLDPTEQAFSPGKSVSVRKVLTALSYCSKCCCISFNVFCILVCNLLFVNMKRASYACSDV